MPTLRGSNGSRSFQAALDRDMTEAAYFIVRDRFPELLVWIEEQLSRGARPSDMVRSQKNAGLHPQQMVVLPRAIRYVQSKRSELDAG